MVALEKKFKNPDPKWLKGQSAWEESLPLNAEWTLLTPTAAHSDSKTEFQVQTDGRVLAAAPKKATERSIISFPLPLLDIKAIRIDALTDPSLSNGARSCGRKTCAIAGKSRDRFRRCEAGTIAETEQKRDPIQREISFSNAFADVTQVDFKAKDVIAEKSNNAKGWAIAGFTGREHALTFLTKGSESYRGPGKLLLTSVKHRNTRKTYIRGLRISVSDDSRIADLADISPDIRAAFAY
ncbi:MAG: hypothetical protein WKF73_14125 [Nocardioidaceae bacterium]